MAEHHDLPIDPGLREFLLKGVHLVLGRHRIGGAVEGENAALDVDLRGRVDRIGKRDVKHDRALKIRAGPRLFKRESAADAIPDGTLPGAVDKAEFACPGGKRRVGGRAAAQQKRQVGPHLARYPHQLVPCFLTLAIPRAPHVRHHHDVVARRDLVGHFDGMTANAEPVRVHQDRRPLRRHAVVENQHASEIPAVVPIGHLYLGHCALPFVVCLGRI